MKLKVYRMGRKTYKTIFVHRSNDSLWRKLERIENTPETNKRMQDCKIQHKYKEVNYFSIYQQSKSRIGN